MNLAKSGTIISVKKINVRTFEVAIKVSKDFNFVAGQYIWLQIPVLKYPDLKGNTRMFSISSSPNKKGELDLIFRSSSSGYKKTLIGMIPGTEVIFSGPYGSLRLSDDVSLPVVFIAGGVGVAPFLSIIRFSNEITSGHKMNLIYFNTNKQETAYLDELKQIEQTNPNFKLFCVYGLLRESVLEKLLGGFINKKVIWSVIGPQGFIDLVAKYLNKKGIPSQDIVFQQFYPNFPTKK